MKKKKLLIVLAGGGFYGQMKQILKNISADEFDLYYVTASESTTALRDLPDNKCYVISKTTHVSTKNMIIRALDFLKSLYLAKGVINSVKPDTILAVGTSMAIPLYLWSFNKKVTRIFVESLTRVNDLSRTGKIIYYLGLADRMYVQWPTISASYQNAIYKGKAI
jgi:beta-1,4-N-acetylglucosaminyltransferase